MTNLRKIIKNNNIKNCELFTMLGISRVVFERKSGLYADFKISELETIKDYFVNLEIIPFDFDIGIFWKKLIKSLRRRNKNC